MMNRQPNWQYYDPSGQSASSLDELLSPPWSNASGVRMNKLQLFFLVTVIGFVLISLYVMAVNLPSRFTNLASEEANNMLSLGAPSADEAFQSEDDPKRRGEYSIIDKLNENLKDGFAGLEAQAADKPSAVSSAASGRTDPFAPLVTPPPEDENGENPDGGTGDPNVVEGPPPPPPPPPDPLDGIQYVGMVDENGNNTVAIFKLNDPIMGNQTVVKKRKEMFLLDGHKCYIKSINRFSVDFQIDGKIRSKALSPFVDNGGGGGRSARNSNGRGVSGQEQQILKGLEG